MEIEGTHNLHELGSDLTDPESEHSDWHRDSQGMTISLSQLFRKIRYVIYWESCLPISLLVAVALAKPRPSTSETTEQRPLGSHGLRRGEKWVLIIIIR